MNQCGQDALSFDVNTLSEVNFVEYITMCLDSTNKLEVVRQAQLIYCSKT
jgi:hypothetical protein